MAALARHPIAPQDLAASAPISQEMSSTAAAALATSAHVHASARIVGDEIAVMLRVNPGYHVNAHVPSFDYLVPTSLSFGRLIPMSVDYPKASRFKSAFAPDALDVYEGEVPLIARFPARGLSGATGIEGQVTAQACDAKACLPPATLTLIIKHPG